MLAALEAVCRAPLLEEECEEAYHFLHDVTREVVETGLGAARRLVLHRRVAEALERQPGDPPLAPGGPLLRGRLGGGPGVSRAARDRGAWR